MRKRSTTCLWQAIWGRKTILCHFQPIGAFWMSSPEDFNDLRTFNDRSETVGLGKGCKKYLSITIGESRKQVMVAEQAQDRSHSAPAFYLRWFDWQLVGQRSQGTYYRQRSLCFNPFRSIPLSLDFFAVLFSFPVFFPSPSSPSAFSSTLSPPHRGTSKLVKVQKLAGRNGLWKGLAEGLSGQS